MIDGNFRTAALVLAAILWSGKGFAQDLEPRRWSHMPTGLNFVAMGAGYTQGDIFFDPVLEIENAEFELASGFLVYLRSFGLFGKSARIDFAAPYSTGRWSGLLQGEPASTRRSGFMDPRFRLSVLLYGGKAETVEEFAVSEKSDWVVGAAVAVQMPFGDYREDKLINLGQNRWVVRPQLGATRISGKWTYELTGSLFWYSDNDEFWNGSRLEQDLYYYLQGHIVYTFRPGLWASLSTGYGNGANASINGDPRDASSENWLSALSVGVPINRQQGLKLAWLRSRTQNGQGADFDSLVFGWSMLF